MIGIIKGGKHSYNDFGLTIRDNFSTTSKKQKVTATIPFMNGSYDFSKLYGDEIYEEITLTYVFNLRASSKIDLDIKKIQISDWLLDGLKSEFYDETLPGYHYLAECQQLNFEDEVFFSTVTATFIAYPFKISNLCEGHDIWDEFNFELDYAQQTAFVVSGVYNADIYNPSSKSVVPEVICSSDIEVITDGITYKFTSGTTKDYRFKLNKGANQLTIKGNGEIEFKFRKEVL